MSLHDLTSANAAGTIGADGASNLAYLMATRWGGEFLVLATADGSRHVVTGSDPSLLRDRFGQGFAEIGRAVSQHAGDLSWEWADGRSGPAPTPLFEAFPRPVPAQRVAHLLPETRELAGLVEHMRAIRKAFDNSWIEAASNILAKPPAALSPDSRVPSPEYLRNAEGRGMVGTEIARLEACIKAAQEAFTFRDLGAAASDYVTGRRVPKPVEADDTAPVSPRP